jgi:hypothetical protein
MVEAINVKKIINPRFKPWAIYKNIPCNRFNGLLVLCAISPEKKSILSLKNFL